MFTDLNDAEVKEFVPGYKGKFIHSQNMTFAYWDVKKGHTAPDHSHPHEQVVNVIEGEFELKIANETKLLKPGLVAIVPPDVKHGGTALTDCRMIDTFYPVREDYR